MIWVLLQSESPWQRNNAITFFIYLRVSLYQEFFLRNRLREFVPVIIASIVAKFEQILWERFRDILKGSFKHHKNSEIAWMNEWMNEWNAQNLIWSRVFRPSTPRNLIGRVLTICQVKLTQGTALEQNPGEQKRLDLRSLSPALRNLWLLLVHSFTLLISYIRASFGPELCSNTRFSLSRVCKF